ncbi:MAG: helix-turn-helix transcriptional regulator [Chitinophagaceae bacterium]|nr:helix-turn-helix transcriptional regulator [Chitinophagaceae bacterium]
MEKTIHQGRNVRRFRELLGHKQEAFASMLGDDWTQIKVSRLEAKEEIESELMEQIAKALKLPVEAIKNFDEENAINIISNNSFENCEQTGASIASILHNPTINPVDKWMEALEENKSLYLALLKEKDEKIALLEKLVNGKIK